MSRKSENTGFICEVCGREVLPVTNGSYRNHCPFCLSSKHVDVTPGDRASDCGGVLRPIGVDYKGNKGWMILHRCDKCGYQTQNKAATDTVQPDDMILLSKIANHERK